MIATKRTAMLAQQMVKVHRRGFASGQLHRSFMLKYTYVDDAYYMRIPYREAHEEHIKKFKDQNEASILAAPFFPYTGAVYFIEQQNATENLEQQIENFVQNDPYYKKKLVQKYELRPVAMSHVARDFDRLAEDYLIRS